MSIAHLSLILIQMLSLWTWSTNAICCNSIQVHFSVNPNDKCERYYPAYLREGRCVAKLCGGPRKAGRCCGQGPCNMFCCQCALKCWSGIESAVKLFYAKYSNLKE